jgi:hypothetical protein
LISAFHFPLSSLRIILNFSSLELTARGRHIVCSPQPGASAPIPSELRPATSTSPGTIANANFLLYIVYLLLA